MKQPQTTLMCVPLSSLVIALVLLATVLLRMDSTTQGAGMPANSTSQAGLGTYSLPRGLALPGTSRAPAHLGQGLARRNIYCFWTGTKPMGKNRAGALADMMAKMDGTLVLVTPKNLSSFVVPEHPLHPAYKDLHLTHKGDYLKVYFMHHYGGGYSDVKYYPKGCNYAPVMDHLSKNDSCLGVGYQEVGRHGMAPSVNETVKDAWRQLIGNGAYVFKPQSIFTREWIKRTEALLDRKALSLMKAKGGESPRGVEGYPIGWTELHGDIFHLMGYEYRHHLQTWLQPPSFEGYRNRKV